MASQIPTGNQVKRILRVNADAVENGVTERTMNLAINLKRWPFIQDIEASFDLMVDISEIPRDLFNYGDDYAKNQDVFVLNIRDRWCYRDVPKIDYYDSILRSLPVTKELILDIPDSFQDDWYVYERNGGTMRVPMVEEVTLRPATNSRFQTILSRISSSCPNLKRLNIYYTLGAWDNIDGEFRLALTRNTLEMLTIDVTPAIMKTKYYLKRAFTEKDFFLLELDYSNGERWLYKISMDLSTASKIQNVDLRNFTRGKDYVRVQISIASLQHLKLCMRNGSRILKKRSEAELFFHAPGNSKDIIYADIF